MDVIVTHASADLDAVASLIGANRLYEEAVCLKNTQVSKLTQRYVSLHRDMLPLTSPKEIDLDAVGTVIVVDNRKQSRLSEFTEIIDAAERVVVYDHHRPSGEDIRADEVHVEPVGACATLLCEAIDERDIELDAREATLMLLGIYADTGRLSFSSTTARDVEAAAYLLRKGAKLSVVNRYLRGQFTRDQRRLLTELLTDERILDVSAAEITLAIADAEEYVEGASEVVEYVMEMSGAEAMFAIVDFDDGKRIQVIGRSRVPYVDVGEILTEFGGGGHPGAAGATFKDSTSDEVADRLESVLREADIDPTTVRDLMSSPVHIVDRDISLADCRAKFDHWDISGAPVVTDGEIEGIISRRDIRRAERQHKLELPVSSHMSHEAVTVEPDMSLESALELMTEDEIGRLPILDDGRLVGIVTRTDILDRLYGD